MSLLITLIYCFYPAQYSILGWVIMWHVSLSVCQSVGNHFSPHPPPYIELSFSSSLCWSIYSPQTSQFQVLEEGSVRTCVAVIPQGPPTIDMRVKVSGKQVWSTQTALYYFFILFLFGTMIYLFCLSLRDQQRYRL